MGLRIALALIVVAGLCGCGGDETSASGGKTPDAGGPDGGACGPGTTTLDDGACQPAGVPPDGCGAGFEAADVGCTAVLPAAPCADGTMAVPGEDACHEVAPCADGTWGDLALEADSEHVDQAYVGGASDGSEAKPWTTIQEAVDDAADGAIVAVAAGTYAEDVAIAGKHVRLWGRCPGLVEVNGSLAADGAIVVGPNADGTEVSRIAVSGSSRGIVVGGTQGAVLDRVWIHDTASQGVAAQNQAGPTDFQMKSSLVERAHDLGVFVIGAAGVVESSVVRDTRPDPAGLYGRGVSAELFTDTKTRGSVTLRGSLVELSREYGVYVSGSDAVIETTLVRDTMPVQKGNTGGRGISVRAHSASGNRSNVQISHAVIERVLDTGVYVAGSEATLEATSIRDVGPAADGRFGRGLEALPDDVLVEPPRVELHWSVIERTTEIGIMASGADLVVEGTVVRDVVPGPVFMGGRGINAQFETQTQPSTLALRGSVVERALDVGVYFISSTGSIESSIVRDVAPNADGSYGDAVSFLNQVATLPSEATVTGSLVAGAARAGISSFGAIVHVGTSQLDCNQLPLDGEVIQGREFLFEDTGGNRCGCGDQALPCSVLTSNLAAPTAVDGAGN